jgi:hypothetical protein
LKGRYELNNYTVLDLRIDTGKKKFQVTAFVFPQTLRGE